MFTLLMYAICLCLLFRGVQIFQTALVSTGPWRAKAMQLGFVSMAICTLAAVVLGWWFTEKSWDFDRELIRILTGPQVPYR